MDRAVQDEVRQHLPVGSRIGVEGDPLGDLDLQRDPGLAQARQEARHDLAGGLREVELPSVGVAAIDRDLLEGLHELARALEVGDELVRGVAAVGDEALELGAPQGALLHGRRHGVASAHEAGRDREADPDRIVDLVGHARDQRSQRREFFGVDERRLGLAQGHEGRLGSLLGGPQVGLRAPSRHGVLLKDVHGAGHVADLVAGVELLDDPVAAGDDVAHRRLERLEGTADGARGADPDQDAGGEEEHPRGRDLQVDGGERVVEPVLGRFLGLAGGGRQAVEHGGQRRLAVVDGGAQELALRREGGGQPGEPGEERGGALGELA